MVGTYGVPPLSGPPIDFEARRLRGSRLPAPPEGPIIPALSIDLPAELVDNVEAAAEWRRVIAPSIEAGAIVATDRAQAVAHCELWATWRSQLAEAAGAPHILFVGPNKHPIPHPIRGMANATARLLRSVDLALGLLPTVRCRVRVARQRRAPSAVDQFLARKKPSKE